MDYGRNAYGEQGGVKRSWKRSKEIESRKYREPFPDLQRTEGMRKRPIAFSRIYGPFLE